MNRPTGQSSDISKHDYLGIFDASPNPYLVLDRRLHIVTANRAYLNSTKRELSDIVGRWAWDAFPTDPETLKQSVSSFERVIRTKEPDTMALLRFDIPRPESEGGGFEQRYWSITHNPVLNEHGEVELVVQHPIDVTELERLREIAGGSDDQGGVQLAPAHSGIFSRAQSVYEANLILKAESDRLRALFAQAPGFMAIVRGPEHRFELTNKAYDALVGKRDLIGKPVREALSELEDQGFFELLDQVYATGEPFVGRGVELVVQGNRQAEPKRLFVDFVYQPIFETDGSVSGIFVEGSDVTEARLVTEELRDREARLRLVVEGAQDHAILITDPVGRITGWSKGAARIFGWSVDEAIGQSGSIIFTPEDRAAGEDANELETARQAGCAPDHRWHVRKDGTRVFMNGSMNKLPADAQGREQGFLKIARDETERRRTDEALRNLTQTLEQRVEQRTEELRSAEAQLRQSQKMEAIGQLTGGVAHDFNNLLTIIRSAADLLKRGVASEEKRARYIDAIADTADRAAKLTAQLLAFARRQALKPEVFDAAARIEAISEMLRTIVGGRIEVEIDLACRSCFVDADASQFETAIVNLVANARDAMEGEGKLTIRVEEARDVPATRGHSAAQGNFTAISVSDTGSGISQDRLERIFEPFFTTKEVGKGTGLGLSQVYGFAKQSGGEVIVRSELEQGTTFTIFLPKTEKALVERRAAQADTGAQVKGRVLLVEDNNAVAEFSRQMLEELGYEPTLANNAAEALALIDDPAAEFDAVFSDVVMPGMSGIELGREIRRRRPNVPVVLTSGYSHVLAEEGTHGFELLHKPYTVEGLTRVLRRAIRS